MTVYDELRQRWPTLSFEAQMGNIGSELSRTVRHQQRKENDIFVRSLERVHELLALTLSDPRWKGHRKEIARFKEVVGDWYMGGTTYGVPLDWLVRYTTQFVLMSRR